MPRSPGPARDPTGCATVPNSAHATMMARVLPASPPDETPIAAWRALGRGHRAALILTSLLCLAFAVRGPVKGLRPEGNDFTIYFDAARAVLDGRSPMDISGWIYPPAGALFIAPFALLPYPVAAFAWSAASLAALAWSAWTVARLLSRPGERARAWLLWAPTALVLRPIDSNFASGQVNTIVFAMVLAGLRAVHGGRELRGAACLGASTALKVVPAIFLAHLAAHRRRAAALFGVTIALALAILPTLPWRGARGAAEDLELWRAEVLAPVVGGGEQLNAKWSRMPGQSLTGVLYRLATDDPAELADRGAPQTPPSTQVLDLARRRVRVASALLLLILFVPILARPAPRDSAGWWVECGQVAITALFLAPVVHKAHYVWLLLPLGVAVQAVFAPDSALARRLGAGVGLAIAGLLISTTAPALVGRYEATYLLVYSAIFLGAVPLYLWLTVDLWRRAFWSPRHQPNARA